MVYGVWVDWEGQAWRSIKPAKGLLGRDRSGGFDEERSIEAMHAQADEACFIANSVKMEVRCEPVIGNYKASV